MGVLSSVDLIKSGLRLSLKESCVAFVFLFFTTIGQFDWPLFIGKVTVDRAARVIGSWNSVIKVLVEWPDILVGIWLLLITLLTVCVWWGKLGARIRLHQRNLGTLIDKISNLLRFLFQPAYFLVTILLLHRRWLPSIVSCMPIEVCRADVVGISTQKGFVLMVVDVENLVFRIKNLFGILGSQDFHRLDRYFHWRPTQLVVLVCGVRRKSDWLWESENLYTWCWSGGFRPKNLCFCRRAERFIKIISRSCCVIDSICSSVGNFSASTCNDSWLREATRAH